MIIVELTYKKSLDEVNEFLSQHRDFLSKYYQKGIFVASGPKKPRDGGIILAFTNRATMEKLILDDPFYQNDIAEYRFIQFEPNKYCKEFEAILQSNS